MPEQADKSYQVFARKYRPGTFGALIGQDSLVRIMKNAFSENRIAQAFILTGVRGVGKTTTARIIAKGLNCVGPDGEGGPTTEPCGKCEPCLEIEAGRHVDVLEMDAASRTSVNDIRDIIDGVQFRPLAARYKIYIIDEVHMISVNAFNALLKTLEEPPDHVKFIFATTEIRAVPVTVLSRCQRFDLRRVGEEAMTAHLRMVASKEDVEITDSALALIIRAAEGSVRDALSLLDQSIALGDGGIEAEAVRGMLGIADRGRILDLLELIMRGRAQQALEDLARQFKGGVEPEAILGGLAEAVHWVSVLKVSPDAGEDPEVSPNDRTKGLELAAGLPMGSLARAWKMTLSAIDELSSAPNPRIAAEMAVIRLCYVAELPSPEAVVRQLSGGGAKQSGTRPDSPPSPEHRSSGPGTTSRGQTTASGTDPVRPASEPPSPEPSGFPPGPEPPPPEPQEFYPGRERMQSEFDDVGNAGRGRGRLQQGSGGAETAPRPEPDDGDLKPANQEIGPSTLEHELVRSVLAAFPDAKVITKQSV